MNCRNMGTNRFDQPASSQVMATPEIFLVAKTLIPTHTRVIDLNTGVTAPKHLLKRIFLYFAYLHWLYVQLSQA